MLFLTNVMQMRRTNTGTSEVVRGPSNVSVVLYGVFSMCDYVCYYWCVIVL